MNWQKKTKPWLSEKTDSKHSPTVFMSAHYISSRVCVFPVPVEMILLAGDNRWRGRWLCLSWKLWKRHKLLICSFTLTLQWEGNKNKKSVWCQSLQEKKTKKTSQTLPDRLLGSCTTCRAPKPPPRMWVSTFRFRFACFSNCANNAQWHSGVCCNWLWNEDWQVAAITR